MRCSTKAGPLARLLSKHAHLPRGGEEAAGLQDGGHLAERLQAPFLAGRDVVQHAAGYVDPQFIARTNLVAQALDRLERDQVAAVDGVAEEDAGVELGDDGLDARGV